MSMSRPPLQAHPGERRPGAHVVGLAVAAVERGDVLDDAADGPTGERVVLDLPRDDAVLDVLDLVPAHAVEPDAGQPLAAREDDAAAAVVPRVALVLAEDRELDAVDRAELLERETEGYRHQD